ncbi:MAG: hypothetical protein E7555_04125 [Ruminococcaceae bacterium]|nr:hypothetical protein [Oscillospiraceae bacterium]
MKRTRKALSVLLSLLMVLSIVPLGMFTANAATEGVLMYSTKNGEATIIGCDAKATGDIIIPDTLGSCVVTAIGLYSFAECADITGVYVPAGVKEIGHYAFADCTSLKTVGIGKGVEKLGNNVFSNCTALEKITVNKDNAVFTSDENDVLYNKEKTELLVFPAANTAAAYTVAEDVKTIADGTFAGSANVKTIVISDSVTNIGANAFLGSRSLESVSIGKGVTVIGNDAFEGCDKLSSIHVSSDNTVYSSSEGVLYNKAKTELIKYPAGNASETFKIGAGIQNVRVLSFSNAKNLKAVTISKDVKTIGASAFYGCINIAEVYYEGSETEWKAIEIGTNNNAILGAKITYAGGEEHGHSYTSSITTAPTCTEKGVLTYKCECGHSYTESIPAKGHAFKDNVCSNCSVKEFVVVTDGTNAKITGYNGIGGSVIIPETIEGYKVNAIADSAFENKTEITSIAILADVKDIGTCAFYKTGYYNTSSNWENGVLYIGAYLIEAQSSVKGDYTVKEGTKVIADFAFASKGELTSVNLPKEISAIGDSAFSECAGLKKVTVDLTEEEWKNVVIGIGNEPFTKAEFTYKVIPHEHAFVVTEDVAPTCTEAGYKVSKCACGEEAREDFAPLGHKFVNNVCSGCGEREFNISIVGDEATILGCHDSLSGTVEIPATISGYKVTGIGEKAFAGKTGIEKVVIGKDVKTIGDMAFAGTEIDVEVSADNADYMTESGVLYNKTKLTLIYCPANKLGAKAEIPVGVTALANGAFSGSDKMESVKIPDSVLTIGASAFEGCTALKNVYFDGTKTEWGKIAIGENNSALTNAVVTYADTSDVELAAELASDLALIGATASSEEVVIIITADKDASAIELGKKTLSDKEITLKIDGTSIAEAEGKYVLTFTDWHKAGNKTETELTFDGETYVVKFVFPVENDGHDYSIEEKVEATCAVDGATRHTCSICGDFYDTDVTPALGHKYGLWVIDVDETCTEEGIKYRECTVCDKDEEGHIEMGTVPAKGHSYAPAITLPTCTDGGFTTFTCSDCGDSYVGAQTEALGHSYGDWTVITEAECEKAGERTHACTVCGNEEKEEIPAIGHAYEGIITEPTYTTEGFTTYTCANCGDSYKADYTEKLSKLVSVTIHNLTINRDDAVPLNPTIEKLGNVNYTVTYEVADESIATVDEDGVVTGKNRGTTQITVTVTDEKGNTVTDICSVEVKFTVLQWITWFFVDLLFGFIKDLIPQQ